LPTTNSDSLFIYYPIRVYDRNGRRMGYDYNKCRYRISQDGTTTISTEATAAGIRLSTFFTKYHSHSEQLVDALKEWIKRLRFTTCRYENGRFHIENAVEIPPSEKGFMAYMIKHLQKEEEYKPILTTAFEIEDSHKNLCKQMKYVLIYYTPISTMPSFEKIILDKIQSVCPTLSRSNDVYLQQDNMFLYVTIFRVIFDTVSHKESSILLSERPLENNRSRLWYGNEKEALGQGDTHVIAKLRKVMEDLVTDNSIKKRIEEYKELHKYPIMKE
jgi:hypothetical protein